MHRLLSTPWKKTGALNIAFQSLSEMLYESLIWHDNKVWLELDRIAVIKYFLYCSNILILMDSPFINL